MKQDEKELCGWFIFCPKQQLLLVKDETGSTFHIPWNLPYSFLLIRPYIPSGKFWAIRQKHVALPLKH